MKFINFYEFVLWCDKNIPNYDIQIDKYDLVLIYDYWIGDYHEHHYITLNINKDVIFEHDFIYINIDKILNERKV